MLAIPTMSVIEQGKMNSIIVDMGARSVRIAAVVNGAIVDGSFVHLGYGGNDVTDYQMKIMTERGYSFTTTSERDIVRDIKEKLSRSALDLNQVFADPASVRTYYELPDGQIIKVGNQRFRCPEAMFQPMKLGKELPGLHEMTYQSIMKCDVDVRKDLYNNIVMSGGSTMFKGIDVRLSKEVVALAPSSMKIKVI